MQRTVVCRGVRHLEQQQRILLLLLLLPNFFSLCHVLAFPKQSNFLPSTFQMGLLKSWLSSTYHTPENLLLAAPLRIVFFGLKYKSTCLIYSTVFENHRNKSHFSSRSISFNSQVNFNLTKIGENAKIQMRHFWRFSNTVL